MTDFIRYYKEGRTHTKYIASIDTHQEKKLLLASIKVLFIFMILIFRIYINISKRKSTTNLEITNNT